MGVGGGGGVHMEKTMGLDSVGEHAWKYDWENRLAVVSNQIKSSFLAILNVLVSIVATIRTWEEKK